MIELEAALAEYAKTRRGADAIDRLGRTALATLGALPERAEQRAWLELLPDPKARTWCVDHLFDLAGGAVLTERFAALATLPPDPRVARAIAPIADEVPDLVERHGSVARDPLFAAIYAAPEDDAPRAVLADALIDCGDPRGELIALQLRGETAGVRELVRAHGRGWLGTLGLISGGTEFRRGFPVRLATYAGSAPWSKRLANLPELATIEALAGEAESIVHLLAGVLGDRVRSLDVTYDPRWQDIAAMALPRLRELRMVRSKAGMTGKRDVAFVRYLETHPLIASIGCGQTTFERLPPRIVDRIDELELWSEPGIVLRLWDRLPQLRVLRCVKDIEIELCRDEPDVARIRPALKHGLGNPRSYLPTSIRRIDVVGDRPATAKLRDYEVRHVDAPPNII